MFSANDDWDDGEEQQQQKPPSSAAAQKHQQEQQNQNKKPQPQQQQQSAFSAKAKVTSETAFASATSASSSSSQKRVVSGFHKPGDADFAAVAVPPAHLIIKDSSNAAKKDQQQQQQNQKFSGNDEHGIGGSTWASSECRCLRCELLRAASHWNISSNNISPSSSSSLKRSPSSSPCILVLLDADNFGYPAFSKKPASPSLFQHLCIESKPVFVWAFYGACFGTYFNVDLESAVMSKPTNSNNNNTNNDNISNTNEENNKSEKLRNQSSTWEILRRYKSVQCTKCAGSSQAADLVIEAVASMVSPEQQDVFCVLLTGDKGLRSTVSELWKEERAESTFLVPECEKNWSSEDIWNAVLTPQRKKTKKDKSAASQNQEKKQAKNNNNQLSAQRRSR